MPLPFLLPQVGEEVSIGFPLPLFMTSRVEFIRGTGYVAVPEGGFIRCAMPVLVYDESPLGSEHELKCWSFARSTFEALRDAMFSLYGIPHIPDMVLRRGSDRFRPYTLTPSPAQNDPLWMYYEASGVPSQTQPWMSQAAESILQIRLWQNIPESEADTLRPQAIHRITPYRGWLETLSASEDSDFSVPPAVIQKTRLELLFGD